MKNAWRLYAWHIKNQQVICVLRNFQRLFLYLTYLNWQFTCPPHKPSGLNFCTKQEKFYISNKIVFPRFIIISRLCETHIYISCGHEGLNRKLCTVVFYRIIIYLFNKKCKHDRYGIFPLVKYNAVENYCTCLKLTCICIIFNSRNKMNENINTQFYLLHSTVIFTLV